MGDAIFLHDHSDGDDVLVPTQLAVATQQEPPPPAGIAALASEDVVRCMICALNLTRQSILEREMHLNACLDASTMSQKYECPTCGKELTDYNEQRREAHVNLCLDRLSQRFSASTPEARSTIARESVADNLDAFAVLMGSAAASSRSSTAPSSAAPGAATSVVSNAFDVLMKSSKTQAVVKAATAVVSSFWPSSGGNSTNNAKKRPRPLSANGGASHAGSATRRRFGCPDFKRILGTQPPFIVDGFRYASKSLSSVYFLTHFHSDHYIGLDKSFDCGVIYCNQVTAALVVQELRIDSKYVHPVPMNTPIDVHGVQVTFMDANHCPGAAILLFRLRSGRTYLHTGDFRFHPKMWNYAALQPFIPKPDGGPPATRLDGVYLDTTYADPKYTFPTQQTAIEHGVGLVERHVGSGAKTLFLFGSYSVGKERLFMEVAKRLGRKVCVSKAKYKMIATYGWPESEMRLLTVEPAATSLHVVPMGDLRLDHLGALLQKHRLRFHEIVAFRPTGWTFSKNATSLSTCQKDPSGKIRIYGIPYSEHSSFAELCDFLRVLNPCTIIPTVNCHTEKQVRKQVDALRQSAFHNLTTMFQPQAMGGPDAS
ncbi:hypothetical protein P43SY_009901 [Pythium insidiosum]|uniref:DNA repair metallo-beta-lactamase domain-containing protein n=1 Tax=Pythium insidiosum TaxID=114742 RepID=A0AAD5Q8X0_PYTIN|nr:hypothetical protein P43SY_009901 [Pythium insidiosum]